MKLAMIVGIELGNSLEDFKKDLQRQIDAVNRILKNNKPISFADQICLSDLPDFLEHIKKNHHQGEPR